MPHALRCRTRQAAGTHPWPLVQGAPLSADTPRLSRVRPGAPPALLPPQLLRLGDRLPRDQSVPHGQAQALGGRVWRGTAAETASLLVL